ncbi:methyltransferase domain-containing protein [bacterium]|nr:MAG: methyltransferase domain-containing protein [bacterium]
MQNLSIRSPKNDRESIEIPSKMKLLQKPMSGSVCSKVGDEYQIEQNILDLFDESTSQSSLAQMTNHWKLTASLYEDLWRTKALSLMTGETFPIEEEQQLLRDWMSVSENGLYLDAGCSTALYTRAIAKQQPQANIVALDFSKEMLFEARERCIKEQANVYLFRADASNMPFFSESFDGIACGGSLNEFFDPQKVLYEFRRILKKDGVLFIMHLLKADSWYGKLLQEPIKLSGIQFWSKEESNALFEKAGFLVTRQIVRGIVCFTRLIPS